MTDRHEHLDEGAIHAWLDGALPPDESARAEAAAASCAECAAMVAEARGLIAASSRILSSLDAVPAGVIPGTSANVDQLAALRARQRASRRHWWQDRRVMVAASLVFVAGVSSLVLRSTPDDIVNPTTRMATESVPAPEPAAPSVPPAVVAPSPTREAAIDAVEKSSAPERDMARSRVAAVPADTERQAKVRESTAPPVASNESRRADTEEVLRRAPDSVANAMTRAQASPIPRPLRQEGARQTFQQLRVDSTQPAPPAAAVAPTGARLTRGAITGGVGAAMADVSGPGGSCYRLRDLSAPAVADTIRLLNESAPVLSDPSWFRTQVYGAIRDTTLAWRSVDSVTVELRSHFGSDSVGVRFRTDGSSDARVVPMVRTAAAVRVTCPS